jgi:hypothetical protein
MTISQLGDSHESKVGTWWFIPVSKSVIEGSLEVKLPTIWRDEKQSREEA